jgi:hypothetical protein
MERVDSSRRMTPSDPSRPVRRVSPTMSFNPGEAGRAFSPRVTVASPDTVRTTPIVSPAMAVPATVGRHRALNRRTAATVFFILLPLRIPWLHYTILYPSTPGECQSFIKKYPGNNISIQGHTGSVGTDKYKMEVIRRQVVRMFGEGWGDDIVYCFKSLLVTSFVALRNDAVVGFVYVRIDLPWVFQPNRRAGVGAGKGDREGLLVRSMVGLREPGYACAIIRAAGPTDFHEKTLGALPIPGSTRESTLHGKSKGNAVLPALTRSLP